MVIGTLLYNPLLKSSVALLDWTKRPLHVTNTTVVPMIAVVKASGLVSNTSAAAKTAPAAASYTSRVFSRFGTLQGRKAKKRPRMQLSHKSQVCTIHASDLVPQVASI
jgi:hypothetical protein